MRTLTVAVAALLLASVIPMVSAESNVLFHEGSIVIDGDDPVVNPLSFRPTDDHELEQLYTNLCARQLSGFCPDGVDEIPDFPDGEDPDSGAEGPTWLFVRGQSDKPYQVSISTTDPVVGTVDVYEYKGNDDGNGNTPQCAWGLAYQLYPEEGQSIVSTDYIVHLQTVTLGSHGVAASQVSSPVLGPQLTLPANDDGYIIAIDARVATGAAGDVTLNYQVESEQRFDVTRTSNAWLYHPLTWIRNDSECLQEGIDLPPTESLSADIPGAGQISLQDLMGTALPTS